MIRLTFREKEKFGVVGMNEANQDKKLYSCVLKLIDYEDTGLSPNDILKLKEENDSYNETMKCLNKLRDENNQLKHQLSEKDEEIESLKLKNQNLEDYYYEQFFILDEDYNKDLEERLIEIKELEKRQTQLAITELEKVKEYNSHLIYGSNLVNKFIDQQINFLKGKEL